MEVADVNSLAVDSNVLLRGVPVGKVTRIETSISNATVDFYINGQYKVPTDSVIRLENLSALGETYIELEPRSSGGPLFRDGQRIASEAVKQPSSIPELAVSVVRVMNQLDPGQLQRVVGEVDTGLPDPFSVLPNLQRASLLLRNTVTDMHGPGQELLSNAQSLLKNAGFVGPTLAATTPAVQDFGPTVKSTWDSVTSLSLRVDDPGVTYIFGRLLKRIQKFLDDRAPDIRMLTEPLTANIQAIAASLTTIDSSQVLTNLLASVPENGAIDLHVGIAQNQGGS
jgi:ABC-type transporter Mla subunit MlaD